MLIDNDPRNVETRNVEIGNVEVRNVEIRNVEIRKVEINQLCDKARAGDRLGRSILECRLKIVVMRTMNF
jgi:hypothetical protein